MRHRPLTTTAAVALAVAAAALPLAAPVRAESAPPIGDGDGGFKLTPVGSFNDPIDAENAPGFPRALFVAEQAGRILALKNGAVRPVPFLDISKRVKVSAEEGLLSFAFHPRYRRNRLLYVYFTNRLGENVVLELKRKRARPLRADHASARRVLRIKHPFGPMHNGGELAFGPDGPLYLSTGDGGTYTDERKLAQSRGTLLGKLLRIDPRRVRRCPHKRARRAARRHGTRCGAGKRPYTNPAGNPFNGPKRGRPEIYSLGLRNPFRYSFDAATGAISIGDVGETCVEEISFRRRGGARGANFGWNRFEGSLLHSPSTVAPGAIPPIFEYGHNHPPGSFCPEPPTDYWGHAVIAGYVVRDPRLTRQYGRLLFSDWVNGQIRTLVPRETGALGERWSGVSVPDGGVVSFAEGARRRLYVISSTGILHRLDPVP